MSKREIKGLSTLEMTLLSVAIRGFMDPTSNVGNDFSDKGILKLLEIDERIGEQVLNISLERDEIKKIHSDKLKKFREQFTYNG
jgi:hypothetical protein